MPEYYEIKIKGQLDQRWSEWFAGLKLTQLEGDVTLLSGLLPDQSALHGLLERIRDFNLILISVTNDNVATQNPINQYKVEKEMSMQKTILVIGGTGLLGQPVSRCLKDSGFQVRIMARNRQRAEKMFDDTIEIFEGDPTDINRVEEALDGCYGVHISLPPGVEQQVAKTVARVAPKHALKRISYISGATVAEENRWFPMIDGKYLAEKAIRGTGIPYTIICPTWVMEILPKFVMQGRASILGKQPCPYHWVAAEDIARMISAAYRLGEVTSQRLIVHGPEAILMHEALRRYCEVFHPEIKGVSSTPFWLIKLLATITGDQGLKAAGEMMAYFEKAGEGTNFPKANEILGVPTMTLDTWLQKRKAME
jgi:uncharacterized protein YbjT (DUF2867 family)